MHAKRLSRRQYGAVVFALALLAGAFLYALTAVSRTVSVADGSVLSVREECQAALGYPARTPADIDWLETCVSALTPVSPSESPTVPPSPTATPTPTATAEPSSPTGSPTQTVEPTSSPTASPTTPAPTTPVPTSSPTVSPTTGPAAWPDASNTGTTGQLANLPCPPAGYIAMGTANQVLQNVNVVDCDINVTARNVVIRNVRITSSWATGWAVIIRNGGSATITDSEIAGRDKSTKSVQYAILSQTSDTVTVLRNNLHHCQDCIQGERVIVADNYIHDLSNPPGAHVDGFQCNGSCAGSVIRHNRIIVDYGQTGCVSVFPDFGSPHDVVIEGNWLTGAGYTIYGGEGTRGFASATNIVIRDNRVDPGAAGWLGYFNPTSPGNVATGNVDSAGRPLSA